MRGPAIHFHPRQMPDQFSWTLSKTILQVPLWVLLPNTIPSYPSPLALPIVHLCCFMVHEDHQINNQKVPFPPRPQRFQQLHRDDLERIKGKTVWRTIFLYGRLHR